MCTIIILDTLQEHILSAIVQSFYSKCSSISRPKQFLAQFSDHHQVRYLEYGILMQAKILILLEVVLTLTHVLHQAVLCLQLISQLTCSHTPESICNSLPTGIVTGGQPSLEHLPELAFRVRETNDDPVQCPSTHFEQDPQGIPLCMHISKLL